MSDHYAPHAAFVRPAQSATDLPRVIFMIATFVLAFILSPALVMMFLPESGQDAFYKGDTTFGTLMQFFTFALPAAAFVWTLRRVHHRGFWSLIGPYQIAFTDLRKVTIGVGLAFAATYLLPPWIAMSEVAEVRNVVTWLLILPIGLLALLIQVTTEEIVFRGYLQQQLACLSRSRIVWMGIPSLLFGSVHYWNGHSFPEGFVYVIWATLLGLACADLTARTGSLGAAIGLHLSTNAFSVFIEGIQGREMSGLALLLYPYEDPSVYSDAIADVMGFWIVISSLMSALTVLIIWLAARLVLRR